MNLLDANQRTFETTTNCAGNFWVPEGAFEGDLPHTSRGHVPKMSPRSCARSCTVTARATIATRSPRPRTPRTGLGAPRFGSGNRTELQLTMSFKTIASAHSRTSFVLVVQRGPDHRLRVRVMAVTAAGTSAGKPAS